jgi:NADP-dependent 3-hydroxy acid dehydrogenase YdfG
MSQLTRQLLAKGNAIIATARDPGAAKELQKLQAGSGGKLTVMQLDVASPESINAWADSVKQQVSHVDVSTDSGVA